MSGPLPLSHVEPGNPGLGIQGDKHTRKKCEICLKLTMKHQTNVSDIVLVFLLLTLNIFHTFF